MLKKIAAIFKKEVMLSVSLLAAIISLFITKPSLELLRTIDWKTLATLFMLLTVLEGFKKENIFSPLLKKTSLITSIKNLTCFFVYSVFFSSMFVTNDVSLIIFVPLTIVSFRAGNKEKYILPVLTLENIAAIRGSLLTPFGSPQNLFIFTQSGLSPVSFMLKMLPLWVASGFLLYIFITLLFLKDQREQISLNQEELCTPWLKENKKYRILYILLFIIVITTVVSRTKLWPFVCIALFVSLLIFDRKILIRTDYVLLLTFLCFFIFSSSICHNQTISDFLEKTVSNHEYWWSIALSQLISNVPASIVLWPFTKNITALLYGLDSAGLCSIIGSLASVINLRLYSKEYPGNTKQFLKVFELISLAFFLIVCIPQWLICK